MINIINKTKVFSVVLLLGILFVFGYLFPQQDFKGVANASAGDLLSGYAWSDNIGWISFNCTNNNSCGTSNYGVNISDGNFSGYAWSDNIGWISFNATDVSGCPSGSCPPAINLLTGRVSGWARALSYGGGWDGFIKLSGVSSDGSPYRVTFSGKNASGYSWGSDVVGWISWSGIDYGVESFVSIVNQAPITSILSPANNSTAYESNLLAFSGTASDPDIGDTVVDYEWRIENCETGTLINSTSLNFNYAFGVAGTYNIYFRAQDNNGVWSMNCEPHTVTVVVSPPTPGVCGSASLTPTMTKPKTGLCDSGTASDVAPGVGNPTLWTWSCSGQFGGSDTTCSTVSSCGNGLCQPSKGETPSTCREDCKIKVKEF
jgi:hypothetical protein